MSEVAVTVDTLGEGFPGREGLKMKNLLVHYPQYCVFMFAILKLTGLCRQLNKIVNKGRRTTNMSTDVDYKYIRNI